MDIFIEQLYTLPQDGGSRMKRVLLWVAAVLILLILLLLGLRFPALMAVFLLLAIGAGYLAFFLNGTLNVEYEYILTAGVVDIDRIQNQRRRKRMISFNCADISGIGRADKAPMGHEIKRFCGKDDGYYFAVGTDVIIFAPNERFREEMGKSLPRYLKAELD